MVLLSYQEILTFNGYSEPIGFNVLLTMKSNFSKIYINIYT